MLGGVHYLDLSHTNIVRVRMLCNVHTLKLVSCKQVLASDLAAVQHGTVVHLDVLDCGPAVHEGGDGGRSPVPRGLNV